MKHWTKTMKSLENNKNFKKGVSYFLLELNVNLERTTIYGYTKKQEEEAMKYYTKVEKIHREEKGYDVVLVGADKIDGLKKAYPNYFIDTKEFLRNLERVLRTKHI